MVTLATLAAEATPVMPPMTRVPFPLAVLRVVIAKVRALEAFGVSSIRPPPLVTLKVVIVSVVGAALLPLMVNLPPWMLSVPATSRPRRLFTLLVPVLSRASVPPLLRVKVPPPLSAVPLKASPESRYLKVPPLMVIVPEVPEAKA